jgi:hypothetical protein
MRSLPVFILSAALLFVLALPAAAQGRKPHKAHPARKRVPINLLKDSLKKLEKMEERVASRKKMNRKQLDTLKVDIKEVKLQIREFLMDIENRKAALPAYECCPCQGDKGTLEINVNIQGGDPTGTNPVETPPEPTTERFDPMTDTQFTHLLSALREQSFADDKLTVLAEAAKAAHFSVGQIKGILKQLSFPDDKLEALRLLEPRIADRENIYQVYGSFVHSSDKDEAKKILEAR